MTTAVAPASPLRLTQADLESIIRNEGRKLRLTRSEIGIRMHMPLPAQPLLQGQ